MSGASDKAGSMVSGMEPGSAADKPGGTALSRGCAVGSIHSVVTSAGLDGPGLRCVVFFQGCPLRCLYCHNPDTADVHGGYRVSARELVQQIAAYDPWIHQGGGVTISGGEPLLQSDFAVALCQLLRERRIHIALDTSGCAPLAKAREVASLVDLVLLDIKSIRPSTYRHLTGGSINTTLEFARELGRMGRPVWIRYVLVPGLTDDREEIGEVVSFVSSIPTIQRIDVLPFHQLGKDKWAACGREYSLAHVEPPSQELIEEVRGMFQAVKLS